MNPEQIAAIVLAIRAHAVANYETAGWDILVECYDDSDIVRAMGDATTAEEAISAIGKDLKVRHDRRVDIQAEAF
jgi:hypothetical protein